MAKGRSRRIVKERQQKFWGQTDVERQRCSEMVILVNCMVGEFFISVGALWKHITTAGRRPPHRN